jgi:aerobic-type carbon monoxide dehydrogenase small subunit (CoxS/CutS family)
MGAAAGATVFLTDLVYAQETGSAGKTESEIPGVRVLGRGKRTLALNINGQDKKVEVEPRTTLLAAIREGLGLTGTKEVCSRGSCGACTVLLDGVAVCSCLMLAVDAEGKAITTIEGVAADPAYAHIIDGYCEHDGAQCGFCIPGMVVRSAAYLKENPSPTPEQIRQGLSGNICRCGTYTKIFDSVAAAAKGGAR